MIARILVIDDDEAIRDLLRDFLESRHHEVLVASDGAQGFTIAEKETPHLIIMDVVMPGGVYGTTTTKKLQEYWRTAQIPIIIMSGTSGAPIIDFLRGRANVRFIPKPIDLKGLEKAIHEMLPHGGYTP